jgi:hypothetical protein
MAQYRLTPDEVRLIRRLLREHAKTGCDDGSLDMEMSIVLLRRLAYPQA